MVLNKIGLVFNVIGSIMVACSFGKNLADAHQVNSKGQKIYLASFLRPKIFWFGMILIIIGFIMQLVS
jgi:hypothetical protein